MKRMSSSALRVPILSWCPNIEAGALKQAVTTARLPFAVRHIALMPDAHFGYGVPIGGVIATSGVVIISAVGVDIGCGMIALNTQIPASEMSTDKLKAILGSIRNKVPTGFNHNATKCDTKLMPDYMVGPGLYPVISQEFESARYQLSSMGGNNHFIEIQKGSDGNIWAMIHSGSRNLGKRVCDYHSYIAQQLNARWHSAVDPKAELPFLPLDSDEGQRYMEEMNYCVAFAFQNRQQMMLRVMESFAEAGFAIEAKEGMLVNVHHNFAQMENHFGRNLMVHRKGATRAYEGEIGIIPGSQGTASYIVKGKGNVMSFKSCSHGAGRCMSRNKAESSLDLSAEIKKLEDQGIIHSIRGKSDLAESAGSYKSIEEVMANQADLVEGLVKLQPLAVIKASSDKRRRK